MDPALVLYPLGNGQLPLPRVRIAASRPPSSQTPQQSPKGHKAGKELALLPGRLEHTQRVAGLWLHPQLQPNCPAPIHGGTGHKPHSRAHHSQPHPQHPGPLGPTGDSMTLPDPCSPGGLLLERHTFLCSLTRAIPLPHSPPPWPSFLCPVTHSGHISSLTTELGVGIRVGRAWIMRAEPHDSTCLFFQKSRLLGLHGQEPGSACAGPS